jgi:hypothetical protein
MRKRHQWHTRPIFVTSTFRDMHAERDWLREHVLPALEERLQRAVDWAGRDTRGAGSAHGGGQRRDADE